jgi:GT2 family glycosyltransferase
MLITSGKVFTNDMVSSADLAVVLVKYNNEDDTADCLRTLEQQTLDDFVTLVVDNGSRRESIAQLEDAFEFPVYLYNDENVGFTGGNNRGIRYALDREVDWILLLNNDTEVEPTFLEDLLNASESLPDSAGIVGPTVHTYPDREVWSTGGIVNPWTGHTRHRFWSASEVENPTQVDYVVGAAILVRACIFRDIGLLDDDFFIYYEETEFCHRASDAGWGVWYVPVSGIYHKEGTQYRYSNFREYYFTRNRWLFVRKTQTAHVRSFFYLYFLLRWFVVQVAYLIVVHRDLPAAKATAVGALDALLGRVGKRHES